MRILIYGGGSVGLGIASCLIKAAAHVDIIARQETVAALREHGLQRTGIFGQYHAPSPRFGAYGYLADLSHQRYKYVLVCTKSFDSAAAAKDLAEHTKIFADNCKIVLFQNGWANAEKFLIFFQQPQVYNARVITGFCRPKPNHVELTVHADAIHVGSLFGADLSYMDDLCRLIRAGGIPCEVTDSIEKDLWAKMLYNCALNPLGAILDVPYGKLAEHGPSREIMNTIVREIFDVLTAARYRTHWQSPADFLKLFYERLVPDTAQHKSSTLQDIRAGKKTEIDALNGAVIQLAQKHGISVPANSVVYNMVSFLENSRCSQ
jgi:2-dehydropantoate 2-reductase